MDTQKFSIPVLAARRLEVRHASGKISVRETESEREVLVLLRTRNPPAYPIEAVESGDTIQLISRIPSFYEWRAGEEVDWEIFVPKGFSLYIRQKQGSLFTHIHGEQDLEIKQGTILVRGISGWGRFRTQIGDIVIEPENGKWQVEAGTGIGKIYARIPQGMEVSVTARTDVGKIESNRKRDCPFMNQEEPGDQFTYEAENPTGRMSLRARKGNISVWFA
jgi:hypothetical protein